VQRRWQPSAVVVLTLVKLTDAEYLISSVASGLEDYYMGSGEAPGVWHGQWAKELNLTGVVRDDQLRAIVEGHHPTAGVDLLAGQRARKVNAFDATFSAPKSASLLWAFGPPEVATVVSLAHVEAVTVALDYLEAKAAFARRQVAGVRSRVPTHGWAVATFVHRTSRAGDPQLHTHCLIPNIVERADGSHCSVDAGPLHDWAKAAGSIYQEELRRTLTQRLEVTWGPDRHGCREMVGFTPEQLRSFSKRSVEIEAYLEAAAERYESPAARMRADEAASFDTRDPKDRRFTPELLRERWAAEAAAVGLDEPDRVLGLVRGRDAAYPGLGRDEVFARLVDDEVGLCAHDSRFNEAHVVAAIAALGAGRLDLARIEELAGDFLSSEHVVRLVEVDVAPTRRRPPEWSTARHRALEDRVLGHLGTLTSTPSPPLPEDVVASAIGAELRLGADQAEAVRALCGPGPTLRSLISPAGFGKTTAVHAGAVAAAAAGRPVLGVATTNQAVGELRAVGIEAVTITRLGIDLDAGRCLRPGTVVVLDEASQTSTVDAEIVFGAVAATAGAQLWALGDVRQAQAVRAGGLAAEIDRLGREGAIPAPVLKENRRQLDPTEREALAAYRDGDVAGSQAIRSEAGWEHQLETPQATRQALACAAVADADLHGAKAVAVLAASHADCEDLADRIRDLRAARGELAREFLTGPSWGAEPRRYAAGDRILLHTRLGAGAARLHNGTTATVEEVTSLGLRVAVDDGRAATLPAAFVEGRRRDRTPNMSHAWARTVDGSQGGTWAQVHLLGSAALDNFKGYVAQSRSKFPTHTWNVSRVIDVDYGGILAHRRTPEEEVLQALERAELKTFAAGADPSRTERRLQAELAAQQAIVDTRPPDRRRELTQAREALARARQDLNGAEAYFGGATGRLQDAGGLARIRREGRQAHARASGDLEQATERLRAARSQVQQSEVEVADLERAVGTRAEWDGTHGWRLGDVARIQAELDHHRASVALGAVGQGDPLAFGIDRLRGARATYAGDLSAVEAALPPDRSRELALAKGFVASDRRILADARVRRDRAAQALEVAQERHWGRKDKTAIRSATARLDHAEGEVTAVERSLAGHVKALAAERASAKQRDAAIAAAAPEHSRLVSVVRELDMALDATRPERVVAIATGLDPMEPVVQALGPLPDTRGGQRVWCGLASEIERDRDRGVWRDPNDHAGHHGMFARTYDKGGAYERPDALIRAGAEANPLPAAAVAEPGAWERQLEDARDIMRLALHVDRPGLDLGLGL
jgi:conjugative relaxase-like TrwC/TraI family protein